MHLARTYAGLRHIRVSCAYNRRMLKRCLWVLVLSVLVGCTCAKEKVDRRPTSDETVLKVGRFELGELDFWLRRRVEEEYFTEKVDHAKIARKNLIRAYTYAEILARHGHGITQDRLKQESAFIRSTTQRPQTMARIDAIFAGDEKKFRKVFVLPAIARQILFAEFFQNSSKIHQQTHLAADKFLREARQSPDRFRELAKEQGGELTSFSVSQQQGVFRNEDYLPKGGQEFQGAGHPNAKSPEFRAANPDYRVEEGTRWVEEVISPLRQGEVHRKVVDYPEELMVVRYKSKDGPAYELEAVRFPKKDFQTWLDEQIKLVPVKKVEKK